MLLKCFFIVVISCNQIAVQSGTTTPKNDNPNGKTAISTIMTVTPGTTVNTPTSTEKTTSMEKVTTTTEPPTDAVLGSNCSALTECNRTISGGVICNGTCQCDKTKNNFPYNETTCLDDSRLMPVIYVNSSISQINISLSHSIKTESLNITYNVTVTAETATTCSVVSNFAFCNALVPGTSYNISVAVLLERTGISVQNSTIATTDPAIPGEVNETQSNLNGPNITLTWEPSEGKVEYYNITIDEPLPATTYKTSNNTLLIYNLKDGQRYIVSIVAFSNGQMSDTRFGSFKTDVKAPDSPRNATVSMVTNSSLTLQWIQPNEVRGELVGYQICVQSKIYEDEDFQPQDCLNTTAKYDNTTKVHNFKGLIAGAFYKFEIFTRNEAFLSNDHASTEVRTNQTEPGTVEELTVKPYNDTLNVTWSRPSRPNGDIISYTLRWMETSSKAGNWCEVLFTSGPPNQVPSSNLDEEDCPNETVSISVNQRAMQYKIEGLAAFTNYTIVVVASTVIGDGPKLNTTQQTSLQKPEQVTDVKAVVINSTFVNISWVIPKSNPGLINYTVVVWDIIFNRSSDVTPCFKTDYSSAECVQNGLHPFWKYTFKVKSSNPAGESVSSETAVITTAESNPGPVENVSTALFKDEQCNATKVKIIWREPNLLNRFANITMYKISDGNQTIQFVPSQSTDPWNSSQTNYSVNISDSVYPEKMFSWQIGAVSSSSLPGTQSNFSFKMENCKPPDWDRSKKISAIQASTTGITIRVDLKFFNDQSQGNITERGFIVSRSKISESTSIQELGGWKDPISLYKIILDELRTDVANNKVAEIQIGGEDCRSSTDTYQYCNEYLPQDTEIYLMGYACTNGYKCSVTPSFGPFRTSKPEEKGGTSPALIACIAVLTGLVLAVAVFSILWCRGAIDPPGWFMKNEEVESQPIVPLPLAVSRKRPIQLNKYEEVLEDLHRDTNLKLSDQYEDITKLSQEIAERSTCNAANVEANKPKNRWVNILPYDHSRVKLQQLDDDDPTSDYVNANYLPGFNNQREYIASQGPLPGTVDDFWRMVWEQNVKVIVMLTQCKEGNRVKCEMYWPNQLREPKQYGEIVVNPISISPLDKYNISIFNVTVNGLERQVTHLHYLDFPDFSANVEYDHFLDFVKTARSLVPHDNDGPIIVHCSAGVGRTGTFIALDRLQMYLNSPSFSWDDTVDIFDIVVSLRENRVSMVQTESQFILIHDCFMKMLEAKRLSEIKTYSDDNLYANEGFDPYPEVLYENINERDTTLNMKTEL